MVGEGKTFISFFLGGNGTSKSATGVNIIANICFGTQLFYKQTCPADEQFDPEKHNWINKYGQAPESWFNYPIYKDFPFVKSIRIVSDTETIKSKTIPEIKKWFPKNEYKILPDAEYETKKEGKPYESKITTKTGFEITLMTYEQSASQFESTEVGVVWFDEPMPRDIFMACVARTRRGGLIFGTLTPLSHSGWIKDEYIDKVEPGFCDYVEADVMDNCIETKGARGILFKKDIDNMAKAYPEDEKEARLHGKFGHLLGLVFKRFNRKIHVIEPFAINFNDFIVTMALDTHPRVPDKATWIATDSRNRHFVIAELSFKGKTKHLADAIKAMESPNNHNNWRLYERLIEPAADIANQHEDDERPLRDRLDEDHGLYFEMGSKKRELARRLITDAIEYTMEEDEMIEKPTLYVFNVCTEVIKEFENHVWDEFKGRIKDEKEPKGKVKDKDDHHIENIGRLLVNHYSFTATFEDLEGASRLKVAYKEAESRVSDEIDETNFI